MHPRNVPVLSLRRRQFPGWKAQETFVLFYRQRSLLPRSLSPTINGVPPHDLEPFLKGGFGPFPAAPPMRTEQSVVLRRRDRPVVLGQAVDKNRTRPGSMPVTGD